jgi:hypothetical protein
MGLSYDESSGDPRRARIFNFSSKGAVGILAKEEARKKNEEEHEDGKSNGADRRIRSVWMKERRSGEH